VTDVVTPMDRGKVVGPEGHSLRHLALAALLAAAAIAATLPIWINIFSYAARNEEQSHSFVALPVAAWLVWVGRSRLKGVRPRWDLAGPAVMAVGWVLSAFGFRTGVDLYLHIGALLVVVGAAGTALGRRMMVRIAPALGALIMVLPVPGRVRLMVAGPLQEYSAQIAQFALDLFAVPIMRSGNVLAINGVDVTIAEACNGMRMVSALAVITYAFVFSLPLRPLARLGILAVSPVIALVLNVIRLIPTVLFYGYTDHDTAEAFHDLSGWGSLALAIGLLLGLVSLLRWLEVPVDRPMTAASTAAPVAPTGDPPLAKIARWGAPTAAAGVLAAMVWLGGFDARRSEGATAYHASVRKVVAEVPYQIGGAFGVDQAVSPGAERLLKPNAMIQRRFSDPATGTGFGLMLIHCGDVRDLLDHYPPVCYPANGWTARGAANLEFQAGDIPIAARLYVFTRKTEHSEVGTRVLSFFVLPGKGRGVVNNMEAVEAAARSTAAAAMGAAHIMISFPGNESQDDIATTVRGVLEQLEPAIRTMLGGAAGE